MKEKRARFKAEPSDDKRHDITAGPALLVECSGDIPNEGLCDDVTEQEVASRSVCDHNPELCDVTEYVVSSAADGATGESVKAGRGRAGNWEKIGKNGKGLGNDG